MKDNLQLIGQVILIVLGPLLAKHNITIGNKDVDDILAAISEISGIVWKFRHWNGTPAAVPTVNIGGNGPTSGFARLPMLVALAMCAWASLFFVLAGCVAIQKGNDPVVVNVERAETMAKASFDLVLGIDNSQRDFYRTNAPAYHSFCEWLRQPQSVPDATSTNGAFVILPRCSAMLLSLDNVKLEYKAARADSNEVYTVLQTVTSAMAQANAWISSGVATNSTPKKQ